MTKRAKSQRSPHYPLVMVEWVDSCTHGAWVSPTDVSPTAKTCFSVGWVLNRDRNVVQLAASAAMNDRDEFDQVTGNITIPMGCVVRVKTLATKRL